MIGLPITTSLLNSLEQVDDLLLDSTVSIEDAFKLLINAAFVA